MSTYVHLIIWLDYRPTAHNCMMINCGSMQAWADWQIQRGISSVSLSRLDKQMLM